MQPEELDGKGVLVLGLGISGRSAALFCAARGARVVAADERPAAELGDLSELEGRVRVVTGEPFPDAADFDLIVPSPGIAPKRYRPAARVVWGDIELAFRALEVPMIAVTGTNGKTTTVRLIEAMLRAAGLRAQAAGNLGIPALALPGQPLDVAVLEVSSFQLETTDAFAPHVAVVLNITPDHLDRHGDMEGYAEAKRRILAAQRPDDCAVLNFDDPIVRGFAASARGAVIPISMHTALDRGPWERSAWLDTGALVLCDRQGTRRFSLDSLRLEGRHNFENVLASAAAVWALGADPARALTALIDFEGLAHRCEVVGAAAGTTWVNDSKATNPGAALRSIQGFDRPVVWIAGGRDKGLDFGELAAGAYGRVRAALLIGEAAPQLEAAIAGRFPCETLPSLADAVRRAGELADPGAVVLLAPACASFDQFSGFEERGNRFRELVTALIAEDAR